MQNITGPQVLLFVMVLLFFRKSVFVGKTHFLCKCKAQKWFFL